jgi:hypothetical protein
MITLQGFLSAFNSNISNYVVRGILQKCGWFYNMNGNKFASLCSTGLINPALFFLSFLFVYFSRHLVILVLP